MPDLLQRGISEDQRFRVVAATTTELVQEACRRHDLAGPEAIVLGRAMTAGCLLATLSKEPRERVRIQLDGGGPVGRILVDCQGQGVRGCMQRRVEDPGPVLTALGRPTVGGLVGRRGSVVVTRDLGLDQQYQGAVDLTSGEVDIDIERYLNRSEQLPSVLACAVRLDGHDRVARAGGVLGQTFPGAPPEALRPLRATLHAGGLFEVLVTEREPRDLIGLALQGAGFEASEPVPLRFECNCGPERALTVLSALGTDDLIELAKEPGPTQVRCSFCGANYDVDGATLLELAAQLQDRRS